MAHMATRSWHPAKHSHPFEVMAAAIAAFRRWRRTIRTRDALANLSPEQLGDIGQSEDAKPTLVVKAGLVTNLLSMR